VRLRALITHIAAGWQRHAEVVNLGLGGAAIVIQAPVGVDDAITLSFVAPTLWDPLVVRGRVAWSHPAAGGAHAGVAFEHKSEPVVFALFELVAAMSYE
jgi:hypothetical protein